MPTQVFVNLPVKDLERATAFFTALGFTVNEKFTNEQAACIVVSETIYAMLLVEEFFKTFTDKELVDATAATEVITALSSETKEAVDAMIEKGVAAGGAESREPQDYGFMYSRALEDLDGHQWEFVWMNPEAAENGPPEVETE